MHVMTGCSFKCDTLLQVCLFAANPQLHITRKVFPLTLSTHCVFLSAFTTGIFNFIRYIIFFFIRQNRRKKGTGKLFFKKKYQRRASYISYANPFECEERWSFYCIYDSTNRLEYGVKCVTQHLNADSFVPIISVCVCPIKKN